MSPVDVNVGTVVEPTAPTVMSLAEMAKMHSSEAFYALDDPLEAAVFSVMVELMKELTKNENKPI
ncbi:MAG: hypothetical protein ABR985_11065 [Methanotrichaceae archaeon]|jgi:hypothetical protein